MLKSKVTRGVVIGAALVTFQAVIVEGEVLPNAALTSILASSLPASSVSQERIDTVLDQAIAIAPPLGTFGGISISRST